MSAHLIPGIEATDPARVGGKAAALARLTAARLTPPAFLVIPAEMFVVDDRAAPEGAVTAPDLAEALSADLASLGPGPYAVRSSGTTEDGHEASHAGQYLSLLDVPPGGVAAAAIEVAASGLAGSVAAYRETMGQMAQACPIPVIVQQMIRPIASGIAFSADPVTGDRARAVISAVAGLGDRLAAGEVDGEDWAVLADGTAEGPERSDVLTPDQAANIAAMARRAEATFGAPQDIEWAIDGAGLHILQSRPITVLGKADTQDPPLILDNSNIIESYPGLVSPLTYSFATTVYARVYRAFVRLLGVSEAVVQTNAAIFDNMLSRVEGRVYYNLLNWYRALALLPGFALNRGYMDTMMGVSQPLPEHLTRDIGPSPATGLAKWGEYWRLARAGGGLLWQAVLLTRTKRRFYGRVEAALTDGPDWSSATPTDLARHYRRVEADLLDRWDAPLVNDFLCMIAFGVARGVMNKWAGADGEALLNHALVGQGDIVSAEPAQRIKTMGTMVAEAGLAEHLRAQGAGALAAAPLLKAQFDAYLAKFGDRCFAELKLESIPLTDAPGPLIDAILAQSGRDAAPVVAAPPAWQGAFAGKPIRRWIARRITAYAKARVRDRENLRLQRTRVFGRARRIFLAIGRGLAAQGRLESERDVFHLTLSEVLGVIEGAALSPDVRTLVAVRVAEHQTHAAQPDPPERVEMRDGHWQAVRLPPAEKGRTRHGTGASAGRTEGRARVVIDPMGTSLAPGDILIARHTDPGWIALFANAGGIVVERGSLLSHSAIVAREMGIPCVVGLKGATTWVPDGAALGLDGATGAVWLDEACDG